MPSYYTNPQGPVNPERELDLTNAHLHSLDEVEIPSSLTWIDLTTNRLKELDGRILNLKGLAFLSLRQNLLSDVTFVEQLESRGSLEELILHDNHLTVCPTLVGFSCLRRLEVSYNKIRSLTQLLQSDIPCLRELYAANNKLKSMEGIERLGQLQILELGFNRIADMHHVASLTSLQELYLGSNRIEQIESLSGLTALRILSLQSNRVTRIQGLETLTGLQELYLGQNGITEVCNLDTLTSLHTLDLSQNLLQTLQGISCLTKLKDLWLHDNKLEGLEGLATALAGCQHSLRGVYFSNNPLAGDKLAYNKTLLRLLPNLEELDGDDVVRDSH